MSEDTVKKRTISEEELTRLVEADVLSARSHSDTMSTWRQQMHNEYRSMPYGNEVEGRSKIVTTDIADAIEWIMPSLMRIFAGTQAAVTITGVGPEDEPKARAVSALIYYQLQKKNPFFEIVYSWFKNALRFRTSIIKAIWRYDYTEEDVTYKNVTLQEFQLLMNDPFVAILKADPVEEGKQEEGEYDPSVIPPLFESVKIRIKNVLFDGPCVENVKPETFYIDPEAESIKDAAFCGQVLAMTASDMRLRANAGRFVKSKVEEAIEKGPGAHDLNVSQEEEYRYNASGLSREKSDYEEKDPRNKFEVFEHYCKMDVDKDGVLEDWLVYKCNGVIIEDHENEYGRFPFFSLSPIIEPHSFYGVSIAELVRDIQKIKTSLFRLMLDNMAFMVNGRYSVIEGQVKVQDLIHNNVPGGVVRMQRENAVQPLANPALPQTTFQLLEFVEGVKENRTGVTRYNQGLDSDSLNKTATGIKTIYNASLQRIELIARIFAETGFMDLVRALIDYNRRFLNRAVVVRLGNESFVVAPDDVDGEFDFDVSVGVGNIDQTQRAASLAMGLQMTMQLFGPAAVPQASAIMREWWAASGFKNSEAFVPNPQQAMAAMQQQAMAAQQGGGNGSGAGMAQGSAIGNGSEIPSGIPASPDSFEGFAGANNFNMA
jgi:hypothetical protein